MCQTARSHLAGQSPQPARIKPLDAEQAASVYRSVLHLNGGDDVPVMIREDIGGGPDAER